ncbi:hypothetical protein [Leucobacter sp. wl10]|uniref:hypothetical protein n=1 Tax=Leucobacter sp. wl10 TaxID=2304677 RepID=UPI000E5B8F97|nr:hypothetical protein [Leucobacter sp. wl10]RGE21439.1 hypothetical protein D1J51_06240 [Leucobacter sp. wl10]
MAIAVAAFLGVPLVLVAIGALIIVRAVRALRREPRSRAAAILRMIAGAGVLLSGLLGLLGLMLEMPYGVVILPVLSAIVAIVWGLIFLVAAALVEWISGRRPALQRSVE